MHCNLRRSGAIPVLFRFDYDAHEKFEVAEPISVLTVDTLRLAVTVKFLDKK